MTCDQDNCWVSVAKDFETPVETQKGLPLSIACEEFAIIA
jgi:hypothetical protein